MWCPLDPALGKLSFQRPHALSRELVVAAHHEDIVYEHEEVDVLPRNLPTQPLHDRLCQGAEQPGCLDVPEGQPRSPQETPGPRMTDHEALLAVVGDGHVPESISDIVLREA